MTSAPDHRISASSTNNIRKLSTKSWSGRGKQRSPGGPRASVVGGAGRWHDVPAKH